MKPQIKDPSVDALRDLAVEAIAGVDHGEEPKPEKFVELVYGPEVLELEEFMGQIKVRLGLVAKTNMYS